jgi:endothelin-converting enzyme/putative endopeptidase
MFKHQKSLWLAGIQLVALSLAVGVHGDTPKDVDLTILDSSQSPCQDFYQYACGGWLKKTEIPSDRPMWNRSFSTIDLHNREILNGILKGYASGKNEPANPYSKLLGDFYGSCMDEKQIEKTGLADFQAQAAKIDALADLKTLPPLLATLHGDGVRALFGFYEQQDFKDSAQVIGVVDQVRLGLPDRDYYLKDDAKMSEVRKLYREHITKMFEFLKAPEAKTAADTILKIETELAKVSMSRADRRNPTNVYHRLDRKGLKDEAPDFDWGTYFSSYAITSISGLQAINVVVPDYFVGLNQLLKETSLSDLKTYLKWCFLTQSVEALPKKFVNERFQFTSKAISGQKKLEVRWKRCVRMADTELGFALGRAFVEVAYGKEGKDMSQNMVHEIEHSFHQNVQSLKWMDEKTKTAAEAKLGLIRNKIGYPAVWRSYDGLDVDRHSFLTSLNRTENFTNQYYLNKIGKPVDPNEWDMTPSTVNAYYDPSRNEMVFPAGILQYPFFNSEATDSLNYGAIGVVMGHELTHGFDDEGSQFDGKGNLSNWWDDSVHKSFLEKTSCVEHEYGNFEALPGMKLNGKLTLGENLADQGGIKLSYGVWKSKHPQTTANSSGPNDEQKFFIAFAQSWCQKEQEQYSRMRIVTDPHSPSRYRVNGVVSQFEPFAAAFGCKAGAPMAPIDRCSVW